MVGCSPSGSDGGSGTLTVTFDSVGGSSVKTQSVAAGATATKPSDPTRDDYIFGGWYSDAGLGSAWDFSSAVTSDVTLYAKWHYTGIALQGVAGSTYQHASGTGPLVTVGSFLMQTTEVNQALYAKVMGSNPSNHTGDASKPVDSVNWFDAIVFCNTLSIQKGLTPVYAISGSTDPSAWGDVPTSDTSANLDAWNSVTMSDSANGYRLPTEAEWEFAARGGGDDKYTYSGSNTLDDIAWDSDNSVGTTHDIATKGANILGLSDMSGNVWEFCWDWYGEYPEDYPVNYAGPQSGTFRCTRGGSYCTTGNDAFAVSARSSLFPYLRVNNQGFRVVCSAYKVTFDTGSGSSVGFQAVAIGGKVAKPSDPTYSGYSFAGWYKEDTHTNAWDFANDTVSTNVTLYAKWTPVYTVTFSTGNGSSVDSQTVAAGSLVTKPADPKLSGSIFSGWYKEDTCATPWDFAADTISAATTIYAKWMTYAVGDTGPAGGIILYKNPNAASDGWTFIEVAPASTEVAGIAWGGYNFGGIATTFGIGAGKANTALIVSKFGSYNPDDVTNKTETYAAKVCNDLKYKGYDWYLPSRDELNLMYDTLKRNNLGGFADLPYWSSSQRSGTYAFALNFTNGDAYNDTYGRSKGDGYRVRAIRYF